MFLFGVNFMFSVFLTFVFKNDASRLGGVCPWTHYSNSSCPKSEFRCFDGACIGRHLYCDGTLDCDDGSDERFCNVYSCETELLRMCHDSARCIPFEWFCDGIEDCGSGEDEICDESSSKERDALPRAFHWLESQKARHQAPANVWGPSVDKLAVSFYLGNSTWPKGNDATMKEMAYELSIKLLSRMSQKKLEDIPSSELASYVNAFLVTCLNPRNFHRFDIVQELRDRVDSQNDTNPYVILSLCNAGDTITDLDRKKLVEAYVNKRREHWTDIRALAVMALACSNRQNDVVDLEELTGLLAEEYGKETGECLQTAALVMQALISANTIKYNDSFDEAEAMLNILAKQDDTGSFGNVVNTYYVLPVLNCQSLADIGSEHCESYETLDLEDMAESAVPHIRLVYSIWIGNSSDMERRVAIRVPANVTFYEVMQIVARNDHHYRFESVTLNDKPYVTAILGKQNDPENGECWFLYEMKDGKPVLSYESPADIIPQDTDHILLWYHGGLWID